MLMKNNNILMLISIYLTLVIAFFIRPIDLFNFDTINPIVFYNSYNGKESHFGAAISLLNSKEGPGWVVIGAPKANSSIDSYKDVKEPGVVWKCSLGFDNLNYCEPLLLDSEGQLHVKIEKVPDKSYVYKDKKDYGMLGESMFLGDRNRFVTCSSRWINQKYKDTYFLNGLCYWMTREELLSESPSYLDVSRRLIPLVNYGRQGYDLPISTNNKTERRFDWAYGQAGFSVHISKNDEVVLGAPGVLEWTGSVIKFTDADPNKLPEEHKRFNKEGSDLAQVIVARAQSSLGLHHGKRMVSYFEYFGYSITSGNFLTEKGNRTQFAAGAPRGSSLSGRVLIFSFKETKISYTKSDIEDEESLNFIVDPIEGNVVSHFGSYFGSTLGALDVNGDGLDDLLIGAPFYESEKKSESLDENMAEALILKKENGTIKGQESEDNRANDSGDEGCVFLYFSIGTDFDRNNFQEICGDSSPGARFGTSIAALGDINNDGFQDVAIGAPYESEGQGAVYVYIGSLTRLIFSQKLTAEKLASIPIRGFGYSLSGNTDIDENSYKDLAVGAYESNHVVIYRSVPVVNIQPFLNVSTSKFGTETGNFSIKICYTYDGVAVPTTLEITTKLTLDMEIRKSTIVRFSRNNEIKPEKISKNSIQFTEKYSKNGSCFLLNATTVGDLDLVTQPVTMLQEYWLPTRSETTPEPLLFEIKNGIDKYFLEPSINNPSFELFNTKIKPVTPFKALNLNYMSIPIVAVCEEDGNQSCEADIRLKAIFKSIDGEVFNDANKFIIGSYKSILIQIEVSNMREIAHLPLTAQISWKNEIVLKSSRSDCKKDENVEGTAYTCSLLSPLSKNRKEIIELELDMTMLYAGEAAEELVFKINANTSSGLFRDPEIIATLPVTYNSQLELIGQVYEASYYENENLTSETINFTQLYEVKLSGISPVIGVQLLVGFPSALWIDDERIELLRIREPLTNYEGDEIKCNVLNGSFQEERTLVNLNDVRSKRSVLPDMAPIKLEKKIEPPILINCNVPNIECVWVECDAYKFKPIFRALVEFRLRLVTESARYLFIERDRKQMIIESVGEVTPIGDILIDSHKATSQTIIRAELYSEIKAWILIVAFCCGLLLLAIIIIVLIRCGFFRRTKHEELEALKAKKEVSDNFGCTLDADSLSLEYFVPNLESPSNESFSEGNPYEMKNRFSKVSLEDMD